MATADDLLRSMDEAKVDRSVVAGFGWTDENACTRCNEYIVETANRSDGRIIPFIGIAPYDVDYVRVELDRWRNCFRGIGELYEQAQGFDYLKSDVADVLFDRCVEDELFALLHISEQVGHLYPGKEGTSPERVAKLIDRKSSELKLILAHWGGGLGFYEMMPEIASKTSKVYYDCAASQYLYDPKVYSIMTQLAPGRVLFGSDFPLVRQERAIRTIQECSLSEVDVTAFLGGNALTIGLG